MNISPHFLGIAGIRALMNAALLHSYKPYKAGKRSSSRARSKAQPVAGSKLSKRVAKGLRVRGH